MHKKTIRKILPAALLTVPLLAGNLTNASENKSVFNMKLLILNEAQYEPAYDINGNRTVDVFDIIRVKQKQYNIGSSSIVSDPPVTTTVAVTLPAESTESHDTTTVSEEVTSETTLSDITEAPVTTASQETTVSETTVPVTTTELPVTTTVITTTEVPATTTTVTTTEAPAVTTTITTTAAPVTTTVTTTAAPPVTQKTDKKILNVRHVSQKGLPTGCEATGLTITINWYGYNADKEDIAMTYMPRQEVVYRNGQLYGPDFMTTFAGNPKRDGLDYGCYIPCMITTVNNYFNAVGSSYRGKSISGTEAEDLLSYIDRNIPVAVIATPDLITPSRGDSWITPDGRTVTWQKGHHCLVLIGYDKTRSKVYFSDPARSAGNGVSVFDFGRFKQIYDMKGKNAMIIDTGSVNVPKKTLKVGDKVHYVGWINGASEGNGNEIYVDNTEKEYTVTFIHTSTALPNRVCLDQLGWVSIDAITQNTAYYGNGNSSGNSTPSEPAEKNPPSTAVSEIKDGNVYNIVNLYSDYYLNVDNGIDKDGTNIYQWRPDQSTEQKFKMSADSDSWKIKSMSSSSGSNRMITASATSDGANVNLFTATNNVTQQWVLKKIRGNAFCIGLKAYPGYVLTVNDKSNGTGSGTSNTSAGNVFISKYTGADNQLWYFQ